MAPLITTLKSPLRRSTALVFLLGAWTAACGDPLVDDSYEGEALASYPFSIESNEVKATRLAVFWWKELARAESVEDMQEDTSSAVSLSADDVEGELKLFRPPPDSVLHEVEGTDGKRLAVGSVLAYADADGSGSRSAGEEVEGRLMRRFILYAPQRIPAQEGFNAAPIPKGFRIVLGPAVCEGRPPTDGDCSVPFGRACFGDNNCGDGTCMEQTDMPWPHGACVLLSPLSECVPEPEHARPVRLPPDGLLYAQTCQSDDDCTRLGRYECDPMAGVCLPEGPLPVLLGAISLVLRAELCGRPGPRPGMDGPPPPPPPGGEPPMP